MVAVFPIWRCVPRVMVATTTLGLSGARFGPPPVPILLSGWGGCIDVQGGALKPESVCRLGPPFVLTRGCPKTATPRFRFFGLFLEPRFLLFQSNRECDV